MQGSSLLLWDLRRSCSLRVKELSPHSGPSGEQPVQMDTEDMEASSNGALSTGDVRGRAGKAGERLGLREADGHTPLSLLCPLSSPRKRRSSLPRSPASMKP